MGEDHDQRLMVVKETKKEREKEEKEERERRKREREKDTYYKIKKNKCESKKGELPM